MPLEQVRPNKPSFLMVVLLACAALLAIVIAAAFVISWRSRKQNAPPYNKHPVSELRSQPPRRFLA